MTRLLTILACLFPFCATITAQEPINEPKIHFNHFFVVVDQDTFDDIQNYEYIKDTFAITENRTTVRSDATYSGFYVYGENTYFEILTSSLSPWQSGIFFSPDHENGLKSVKSSQLPQMIINSIPITREFEGKQVPWFYTARNFGYPTRSQMGVGIMEYHNQYLNEYFPDREPQSLGVSRKEVLTRYSSLMDISQSDRLFNDVIGLTANVTSSERTAIYGLFKSLGFTATSNDDYDLLTDNEFELRVTSNPNSTSRVLEIEMLIKSQNAEEKTLQFGPDSILQLRGDGHAIWSF